MAREIIIHNGQLFKHSLSIEDIISSENYGYGISDDHFRLDIGKTSGGPLIIFDNDNIGRGIQIIDLSSKTASCLGYPRHRKRRKDAIQIG